MGKTDLHKGMEAPKAIEVIPSGSKNKNLMAAYVAADATQSDFATELGQELEKIGIYSWVDNGEQGDNTRWAGGIHPALEQCTHLVVVMSDFAMQTDGVKTAIDFFLGKRKPIVLAIPEPIDPPDSLRSRPRFDFSGDFKTAFREMVAAMNR
jgi:hypothetical protein